MFSILKPLLFKMDPEIAHDLAIKSLKLNYLPESIFKVEDEEILKINLLNKTFSNPIGLAAGFDKSAEVYNSIYKLGFSFVEVGTVTPLGQYGNPKPRIFRLEKDEALINRLGFNNDGLEKVTQRLQKNSPTNFLGINIPNTKAATGIKDYMERIFEKTSFKASLTEAERERFLI